MAFVGIDAVTYGTSNMGKARQFYTDWGLKRRSSSKAKLVFETQDGAEVIIRPSGAKDLPKAIQRGNTIREVTWGLSSKADVTRIKRELSKDREVTEDKDGTLHAVDDAGLGVAFRKTRRTQKKQPGRLQNSAGNVVRANERATVYDRATPLHIGHVVLNVPNFEEARDFYVNRLGFAISDNYPGHGVFLRCDPEHWHHNVFYLKTPDDSRSLNHVAFAVRDIHEMFAGGKYINGKGWKTAVGPGRHVVSSCYFWYFENPCGGAIEYFCDEDYCLPDWKPRNYTPGPTTFAEWALRDGLPG